MGKSVNEYYSEKMKRLLEMQKSTETARLASPVKAQDRSRPSPEKPQRQEGNRGYYDEFRKRVGQEKSSSAPHSHTQIHQRPRPKLPTERTAVDDIRAGRPLHKRPEAPQNKQTGKDPRTEQKQKKRVAPQQTVQDRLEENRKRLEAMETARRARIMRKVRDGVISFCLIFAVLVVMCVVVYRLLFVISDIKTEGGEKYSSEELIAASGVHTGDHLYSFSSKEMGELLMLRCPEISYVDVDRTPPGTILVNVEEEKPAFYADFYGEYRLLSPSLRLLRSVTEDEAKALGCIKLKLPDVLQATAGMKISFADVRNDSYIYDTCAYLLESELSGRTGSVNLSDKFNITLTVDSKYKIKLGDSESVEMKLRIASAVLEDEMFKKDIKATVDVTDLSETGVVVDDGLKLD